MAEVLASGKQLVRSLRQAWGLATSDRRVLPALVVAGAQRCGTTSLFQALRQHPAILPPRFHKGLHYFDVDYSKGIDWYRAHFETQASLLRRSRSGIIPIQCEVTPYYMFHPLAPSRIAADLPGVRVAVMLRDPVERAYSAYTHERARGYEPLGFAAALDAEEGRLAGEVARIRSDPDYVSRAHRHQAYAARGRYVEQLRELEANLGRNRIHVIDSGKFFSRPADTVAELLDFLDLPPAAQMTFEVHNSRPRPELPAGTRKRLADYFEPWDAELARWLGWEPSWRRPT